MTGSLETMNDFGPKHILYTDPYRSKYVFSARKMACDHGHGGGEG